MLRKLKIILHLKKFDNVTMLTTTNSTGPPTHSSLDLCYTIKKRIGRLLWPCEQTTGGINDPTPTF